MQITLLLVAISSSCPVSPHFDFALPRCHTFRPLPGSLVTWPVLLLLHMVEAAPTDLQMLRPKRHQRTSACPRTKTIKLGSSANSTKTRVMPPQKPERLWDLRGGGRGGEGWGSVMELVVQPPCGGGGGGSVAGGGGQGAHRRNDVRRDDDDEFNGAVRLPGVAEQSAPHRNVLQ